MTLLLDGQKVQGKNLTVTANLRIDLRRDRLSGTDEFPTGGSHSFAKACARSKRCGCVYRESGQSKIDFREVKAHYSANRELSYSKYRATHLVRGF